MLCFSDRHLNKASNSLTLDEKRLICVLSQIENLSLKSILKPEDFVEAGFHSEEELIPTGIPISTEFVASKIDFFKFCTFKCFRPHLDSWTYLWLNLPLELIEAMEKKRIALAKVTAKESRKKLEKLRARREKKRKTSGTQSSGAKNFL